jgi:hypothetical protein
VRSNARSAQLSNALFPFDHSGYHPWMLDEQSEHSWKRTLSSFRHGNAGRDRAAVAQKRFPEEILLRKRDEADAGMTFVAGPGDADEEVEVQIDSALLEAVRSKPLSALTLQVDLAFMACGCCRAEASQRPMCFWP